jgi:Zn-dependent M28 family amino/carboxypeptidase
MDDFHENSSPLLEYVRSLEYRDNRTRRHQILSALNVLGIQPSIQKCRWPHITNIVVDFSNQSGSQKLLFTSHYDVVKGSPGANDNASSVAVLLGLCHRLKNSGIPVRIVFFDREEAWFRSPMLRLGLLGSLYYTLRTNLSAITAVYNIEFCGSGDCLVIWPVKADRNNLSSVSEVIQAASRLKLPFKIAQIPWPFISSDHLSFRLRGLSNAITLSFLPNQQIPILENLVSRMSLMKLFISQQPILPEPLSFIHSEKDTSATLNEESLNLMLSLLLDLIQNNQIR